MRPVFDYFFPPKCCACDCVGSHLCEYCRFDLAEHVMTGKGMVLKDPYGTGRFFAITACKPNLLLRQVIHAFKYTYTEELLDVLAKLLLFRLKQFDLPPDIAIVPVPLHPRRLRERGFNQSLLMARCLASQLGYKVVDILERTRFTFPQAQLSREDRINNMKCAFSLKKKVTKIPRVIILLDDVMTTGATLSECRWLLYASGAERVISVALAHGL